MVSLVSAYTTTVTADIRDHGLFVASLIHAVAPESDIHLIRVLDQHGCGRLFNLNEALFRFVAEMEEDRGSLEGVVINLSLGVQKPRTDITVTPPNDESEVEQGDETALPPVNIQIDETLSVLVDDRVESLDAAVLLARARGALVVAAAGNDSFIEPKALSPQLPAAYPYVIGVSASNVSRERACFSNWGDVSAPGGDSGHNQELKEKLLKELEDMGFAQEKLDYAREHYFECLPRTDTDRCLDGSGGCDDFLIGLTHYGHRGYSYWNGTSFSTPLVSGLAALVFDAGVSKPICPLLSSRWVRPEQVFDAIRCGAPTPDGVINVPATLFRCMP
jgi:subtilisin family serine protease